MSARLCLGSERVIFLKRGRGRAREEERAEGGVKGGRRSEAHCCSVFAVRRTLMNAHTSHLLLARCARPTDRSAPSSASSAPERVSDLRPIRSESSTSALVCSTSILYPLY